VFGDYELWGYDLLVNHGPHRGVNPDVVIVDFDDATLERVKQYPIPRSVVAELIAKVAEGSPRVVGLDMFLSEVIGMASL
jgi:CHASE2 domain-containing sensor protein